MEVWASDLFRYRKEAILENAINNPREPKSRLLYIIVKEGYLKK